MLATRVLPFLIPLSIEPALNVKQVGLNVKQVGILKMKAPVQTPECT